MNGMFYLYGYNNSNSYNLDLSNFSTSNVTEYTDMLTRIKLKTITISKGFTLKLDAVGLTNSSGLLGQTWYDKKKTTYLPSALPVGGDISGIVTYYDHAPADAYGYKDTSTENETTLVLTYDYNKSKYPEENVYEIPESATTKTS